MGIKRFEIYWCAFDPTRGSEIKKTRPNVIISPDEMNDYLETVIVAPITSTIKRRPFRVECKIKNRNSSILLDQIRTIDRSRLGQKIGAATPKTSLEIVTILQKIFSM